MIWCEKSKTCINLFDNCEYMVSNCNLSCDTGLKSKIEITSHCLRYKTGN